MIDKLTASPLFGVALCVLTFELGVWLQKKTKSPLCNPLLIAIVLVSAILTIFKIPLENFQQGGRLITFFLAPATAVLALSVYNKLAVLKEYFLPVVAGCTAGSVVSAVSAVLLSRAFGFDAALTNALMPKSVTTPIAVEIAARHGGLTAVTVAAVVFTGILGAVFAPLLIRLLKVKDPVAQGVAIGASSHAVGTSRAVELGEIQGAMSGVAIGISGIVTVLLSLFL